MEKNSKVTLLLLGLFFRVLLLVYGEIHDIHHALKYTDIDYSVLDDGAAFVLHGGSPYMRSTYRYTPLFAWFLLGNHFLFKAFGKLIFILCDLLAAWILFELGSNGTAAAQLERTKKWKGFTKYQLLVGFTWILNPMVIAISTRGNAESIITVLVLGTILCLYRNHLVIAGILHGLAVHVKVYPIIFSLPYLVYLSRKDIHLGRGDILKLFTWDGLKFGISSAATFLSITWLMFKIYGWEFLEHAYLYHIGRKDHRHNFSVYHFSIYLSFEQQSSNILSLSAFIPQLLLLVVIGLVYGRDLPFSLFLQTFIFVTFNKVCTSQYFIWFICFLPLVLTRTSINLRWNGISMVIAWILGQALWLSQAYRLEMLGQNTFYELWIAGIIFLWINTWIAIQFIRSYNPPLFTVQDKSKDS